MKIQELLIILVLALGSTWALQYFLIPETLQKKGGKSAEGYSGQRMIAPQQVEVEIQKPINVEIDFLDEKVPVKEIKKNIETEYARYEFSNYGAALIGLEFRRPVGEDKYVYISTVFAPSTVDREKSMFLIALQEKTPFYFNMVNFQEEDDRFVLAYQAPVQNGFLEKTFTVYKKSYQLDLEIAFRIAHEGISLQPRIFFGSPLVPDLVKEDVISAVVNDRHKVQIISKNQDLFNSYWVKPTFFGSQDRYFVHAMINDAQNFVQRGYFKAVDAESIYAILEGPSISKTNAWKVSFYFGPKEDEAMNAVDPRLEYTLNYGLFSFISKPLSKLLLNILNWLVKYVHNYGFAIIIMTVIFRLLLFPLTYQRKGQRKKAIEYQRKLEYIQSKYKDDPQALKEARTELVQKYGLPGLGGGCLVSLVQLPMIWALSIVLSNAIELYQAPFLWIKDLSGPDPYYVLPLLSAIAIIFHQPASDIKQRLSSLIIAVFLFGIFVNLASGLTLYATISTFLGSLQAILTKKNA